MNKERSRYGYNQAIHMIFIQLHAAAVQLSAVSFREDRCPIGKVAAENRFAATPGAPSWKGGSGGRPGCGRFQTHACKS